LLKEVCEHSRYDNGCFNKRRYVTTFGIQAELSRN
jgi:hypothetical protein